MGAKGTRPSLRPLYLLRVDCLQNSDASRRENEGSCHLSCRGPSFSRRCDASSGDAAARLLRMRSRYAAHSPTLMVRRRASAVSNHEAPLSRRRPGQAKPDPGPTPRDAREEEKAVPPVRATNYALWLWVPAFAGTTASSDEASIKTPYSRRRSRSSPQCDRTMPGSSDTRRCRRNPRAPRSGGREYAAARRLRTCRPRARAPSCRS